MLQRPTSVLVACLVTLVTWVGAAGWGGDGPGSESVRYDGHKVVRVQIDDRRELQQMLAISPDHWSEAVGIGTLDWRVPPEGIAAMDAAGIDYEVLIDDVQALIDAESARLEQGGIAAGGAWFDDFKTYEEVNARLQSLEALRPDLAEVVDVGTSLEGRTIHGIRITGPAPASRPAILLNGCQHAREWIAVMVPTYIADRLVDDYDTDPQIQALVDDIEWLIIPIVNPDGYVYTWGPDRLWRKNRRNNGNGTFGVDPNRNWDFEWGGEGASPFPGDETYHGPAPFSEPETQAMRDYYNANPHIVANVDFHSYSQLILWPWGYTAAPSPDEAIFDVLGTAMRDAILSVHGESYLPGPIYPTLYPASGVSVDWAYGDQGVFSYTIELRPNSGFPGFILPPEEIIPTAEESMAAMIALGGLSDLGPAFSFPLGLPALVEADSSTTVTVQITPVGSPLEPGTAVLQSRLGAAGSFTATSLVPAGGDLYEGALPAAPCGETIEFYFEVETGDGSVHQSPDGAPGIVNEAEATTTTVIFADDFETDEGWSVSDDPGLAAGTWERGTPAGGGDRGDPPADGDGSGQCYLTFNVDGDSDVDGGATTLTSPVLDASDPDAALAYWRWYSNDFGGNPFEDVFVVEVSDDGGGSWHALETVGPGGSDAAGGWNHVEFRIADVPGVTNTSTFQVRFNASDLGGGSVVEAAVDGVQIVARTCPSIDGDIDGDGSVGTSDLLILLAAWGSCPDPPDPCPADLDGDGSVGTSDLLLLLSLWG